MTQTFTADEQARSQDVRAEHVELSQGGANAIHATSVNVNQGGAGVVRASEVSVSQGGIGVARAERIAVHAGSSIAVAAAGEVTFEPDSNVMLLIARNVSGQVRPLIDWRAAAAFGAGLGLVVALLRRR